MNCSIQQGEAELNGTLIFHRMKIFVPSSKHQLFVLYNLSKDSNFSTNLKHKVLKNDFSSSKILYKPCVQLSKYYADACESRNAKSEF